jgi:hypothetical protein
VTVNVLEPGTIYGERANQLDIRVAKIPVRPPHERRLRHLQRVQRAPLTLNNAFGVWQRPTEILLPGSSS